MGHGQIQIPFLHHRLSLPDEMLHLYLVSAVRTFLSSSAAIFLPLYVYQASGSLFDAFLFMVLEFVWLAVTMSVVVYTFRRVVFEWLGLASTVAFVALFSYVYLHCTVDSQFLLVAPMIYGISGGLYWLFHNLVYSVYGSKHASKNVSYESIINTVVGVLAPIISGSVAYFLGYHIFFALASAVSILYLALWTAHLRRRTVLDMLPLRRFYASFRADRAALYFIGGIYTVPLMSIPLYLVYASPADTPAAVGAVLSLSALFGVVVTYILGRYVDEHHDYPLAALGFALLAFLLLHMLYTPEYAHILASIRGVFGTLAFLPAMGWIYKIGSKSAGAEIYLRELSLFSGRLFYLAVLLLTGISIYGTILLGAYALIAYGLLFYYLSRIRYPEV